MSSSAPSSFLFTGPEGCGKGLAAIWYAAELNCHAGCTGTGQECASCSKISRLEHPDLYPVFPLPSGPAMKNITALLESRRDNFFNSGEFGTRATSIGIDAIRDLKKKVARQPFEASRPAVIVFEAHLATIQAQNSFLKLLEEPPGATLIILVTEFPDRLLPTITSRCFRVRFDYLTPEAVTEYMGDVCKLRGRELEEAVTLSGGSLRRGSRYGDERFMEIAKKGAGILGEGVKGGNAELAVTAQEVAREYNRDEIMTMLGEMKRAANFLMKRGEGVDADFEKAFYSPLLGEEVMKAGRERDYAADLEKISRAARSLQRNANTELTLAQLFLDLAGLWY